MKNTRTGTDQQALTKARTREANAKSESLEMANLETGSTLIVAAHVPPTLNLMAEIIKETILDAVETACRKFESKHNVTLEDGDFLAPMRLELEKLCARAVEVGEDIMNPKSKPVHEESN